MKVYIRTKYQRIAMKNKSAYVSRALRYSTIKKAALAEMMATDTGLPKGVVLAVWAAVEKQMIQMVMNGHGINLDGLGIFAPDINAHAVENAAQPTPGGETLPVDEWLYAYGVGEVYRRKFRFYPDKTLWRALQRVELENEQG